MTAPEDELGIESAMDLIKRSVGLIFEMMADHEKKTNRETVRGAIMQALCYAGRTINEIMGDEKEVTHEDALKVCALCMDMAVISTTILSQMPGAAVLSVIEKAREDDKVEVVPLGPDEPMKVSELDQPLIWPAGEPPEAA